MNTIKTGFKDCMGNDICMNDVVIHGTEWEIKHGQTATLIQVYKIAYDPFADKFICAYLDDEYGYIAQGITLDSDTANNVIRIDSIAEPYFKIHAIETDKEGLLRWYEKQQGGCYGVHMYTGFRDKNGKRIFACDDIEIDNEEWHVKEELWHGTDSIRLVKKTAERLLDADTAANCKVIV